VNDFSYAGLPRHYEEAVLLCEQQKGGPPVNLPGRGIRPETRRRFVKFIESLHRLDPKKPEDYQTLWREFGDTYWFYHLSRSTPTRETGLTPAKP
jgi:hypothetical protein